MTTLTLAADEEDGTLAIEVDPLREDDYWRDAHLRARYASPGLDYEDFAPAYCVGYTGFAQYGGCFDEAEKSLCANWVRIKGDSRLSYEQALPAIRAAWERSARREPALA